MRQKDLHIIFGLHSKNLLMQSEQIDPERSEILVLHDSLSLGPLYDLYDKKSSEYRNLWWDKIGATKLKEDEVNYILDETNNVKNAIDKSDNYDNIYLWLGHNTDEIILTARILHYLKEVAIPVFKLNLTKTIFTNDKGMETEFHSIQMMKAEHVQGVSKYFEELNINDKTYYASLWEQIGKEQSFVRIFGKSMNYVSGDETFLDQFLINNCKETVQTSSYVVAYTLFELWNHYGFGCGIGDLFLYYRLRQLGKMGKIEIQYAQEGTDRRETIFDVKYR
ncbi:DUF1835 domain-containing protein [Sphingobacterium psychroaquaticum]|uniref:DUF1835 domain-containing protein n=1 Tax=Sphingobacterium psychroaquaticum TaxID=561061 RepID=UPI00106CF2B5|nr:DUF1835 domain-containing protein [Sphingobacterium psychroaquaticum]QBQ41917.1 DUF1835 domain-containing protein [Sphingobacterium psychroaquaticum]